MNAQQMVPGATAPGEPQAARGRGRPEASDGFLHERDPVIVYPFIEAEQAQQHSAQRACRLLQVSRAACYAHRAGPSARDRAGEVLAMRIRAVHAESKGRYGAPRVHADWPAAVTGTAASASPGSCSQGPAGQGRQTVEAHHHPRPRGTGQDRPDPP
jgi:hypothetical protein